MLPVSDSAVPPLASGSSHPQAPSCTSTSVLLLHIESNRATLIRFPHRRHVGKMSQDTQYTAVSSMQYGVVARLVCVVLATFAWLVVHCMGVSCQGGEGERRDRDAMFWSVARLVPSELRTLASDLYRSLVLASVTASPCPCPCHCPCPGRDIRRREDHLVVGV